MKKRISTVILPISTVEIYALQECYTAYCCCCSHIKGSSRWRNSLGCFQYRTSRSSRNVSWYLPIYAQQSEDLI